MVNEGEILYYQAKARVVRALARVTFFVTTVNEYLADKNSTSKRAKVETMFVELKDIRTEVNKDIDIMEHAVSSNTAPEGVTDNTCSISFVDSFDSMYYDLMAMAKLHKIPLSSQSDTSQVHNTTQFGGTQHLSIYQLPKRSFPIFSGDITEFQGFEDLFLSILSHTPDMSDVEKFECLRTSLVGEALSLIVHLTLTPANYKSAWDILRSRYGNKRDLARIHLDALLTPHTVTFNNADSIKRVINTILEHTAALDNLTFVTRQWGPILIHIFEKHLDYELRSRWELTVGDNFSPQINEFVDFLRSHIRSAEVQSYSHTKAGNATKPKGTSQKSTSNSKPGPSPKVLTTSTPKTFTRSCAMCKDTHSIRQCPSFLSETPTDRFQLAKKLNLCINCLGSGHSYTTCPSKNTCKSCQKNHHSLLHFTTAATSTATTVSPTTMLVADAVPRSVLLSTLLVNIQSTHQEIHTFRALLDTGSQVSFITKNCADRLSLARRRCSAQVNAFSGTSVNVVSGITSIRLSPVGKTEPLVPLDVFIVSKITDATPQSTIKSSLWSHLTNLDLADPTFNIPGPIDILLGADVAPTLLTGNRIAGQPFEPTAFGTIFGWVLMGPVSPKQTNLVTSLLVTSNLSLEHSLTKFWEMEEPPNVQHLSPDEIQAEAIFTSSIKRLESGRFSVALPFKHSHPILGDSKSGALKRFHSLEHRLSRDENLNKNYSDFMRDYLENKHMEAVPKNNQNTPYCYYIPHHCILRPESQTTKLRVVFDASARTTTGQCLNTSLYTGRKLQQEITQILIRARVHKFLFTADIKQMYRQIEIHHTDRDYLRIFWRFNRDLPIDEYRLCTVTYGTSCAPYQALRTLQHLAKIEGDRFPVAANVILNDTFVDDILTGASSEDDTLHCQQQVISLCAQGKFQLRKWASNLPSILQSVPTTDCLMSHVVQLDDDVDAKLKILGMQWNPTQDQFSCNCHTPSNIATKRSVLSDLARIFDPLGFLSPVTFMAKHLMQLLWASGIGWDDPIPVQTLTIWQRYQQELNCINELTIPRRITLDGHPTYELHSFSDSSEKGYAAAVYLRCNTGRVVRCYLILAKSKVAPLKRVTIARLELCGALLAAKLLHSVHTILTPMLQIESMQAWTDSTTTLAWIKSSPHRWTTFIANRTSQLHEYTPPSIWRYVPTADNPVDCASRGLYPSELLQHPLWWTGPSFLSQDSSTWPSMQIQMDADGTNLEERKTILLVTTNVHIFNQLLHRISSLPKIIHVVAYCLRIFQKSMFTTINLSPAEQVRALQLIIQLVQKQAFSDEWAHIRDPLHPGQSKLRNLSPFFDEHGLIRVGGRLKHAEIPYEQKHPILLPRSHRLTDLLIDDFHTQNKHPGATTLQTIISQQYWIIGSRQVIRSRLRLCIACYKTRPRKSQPFMGDIPKCRLQQVKPFMITGVDYAGPIMLRSSTTRRNVPSQAYICLFVCMTTKALHLEVASDLSSETFLMAFCRFISRRGPVEQMHSDCGTNFVGAAKLFQSVDQFTHSKEFQDKCHTYLMARNISWHFNPPSAPHFGGLWEAGVKSVKTLLY